MTSDASGSGGFLGDADLAELRQLGRASSFKRGQRLVFEGDRGGSVMVIEAGRVKIVSSTPDGDEMILAVRGAGQLIGDLAVLGAARTSAAVVALDDVSVTVLTGDRYLGFLEGRPQAMLGLIRRLIVTLRESDDKLLELATADVERRLVRRMLELVDHGAEQRGPELALLTRVSQEELAGMCGASREAVARVLRELRDAGVVQTDRRQIVITDIEELRARAWPTSTG